ncbi:PadR family transcriptional regulator [Lentilactobacillus sp. SPB1-3]|uniref:PadR family transcriptional regulator n=1 Tax=Lentilactobacillus terminaliae TaxID=3003483 RepID=A0ACD5DGE0_9LACO|nr:PadR family transcriptional regulator [Lentilactobacillus sp. SPB1-3]MCZ0976727.1 PadR family transcriptional regulator [Lentilactobacillus sp. SPB1-3]
MAIQITSELLDGSVLALLSKADYYGYSLTQKVQEYLPVSESTMYPVLRRLTKNNFLETYDEPYQGRNRRYYRITDQGRDQFKKIKDEWTTFKTQVDLLIGGND